MQADILAIGAHMGDEVAWAAALAAERRQGHTIGLLHLTPGEKGNKNLSPEQYAAQKRKEAAEAAEVLGAAIWTLDYGDGELPVNDEVKWKIADVIREAKPRALLTHWKGSMHKDHTAAYECLADAQFYAALPAFIRKEAAHSVWKAFFGENWEDLRGYVPEVFIELTPEDMEVWEKAMRCYELFRGGISSFPYLDYYKALFRSRGCEGGFEYASTFSVPPEAHRKRVPTLLGG